MNQTFQLSQFQSASESVACVRKGNVIYNLQPLEQAIFYRAKGVSSSFVSSISFDQYLTIESFHAITQLTNNTPSIDLTIQAQLNRANTPTRIRLSSQGQNRFFSKIEGLAVEPGDRIEITPPQTLLLLEIKCFPRIELDSIAFGL